MDTTDRERTLIIIGGGPTAMGALFQIYSLLEDGRISKLKVLVIEKEAEVGGLARSITDENDFTWDLGVHVTGTSRHEVFTNITNEAVKDWNKIKRSVKADLSEVFKEKDPSKNYVPYPVQQSIPYFPLEFQQACIYDLRNARNFRNDDECSNFADFTSKIFGKTLQNIFIRPYNHKHVKDVLSNKTHVIKSLEEMSFAWASGRVPPVDLSKIELRCGKSREELEEDSKTEAFTCFRYPKYLKGAGNMWKLVAQRFPVEIFHFNEVVVRIFVHEKKLETVKTLDGSRHVYSYDYLLSTIPITQLGRLSLLDDSINLKYSKVILVGIGVLYPQTEWTQRCCWAYFPYSDTVFYRCTFLSNFNDYMTPDCDRFWSVLCELSLKPDDNFDESDIISRTIQGLKLKGIINDKHEVVDKWIRVLPFGYPIPTIGRDEELRRCHDLFQKYFIYSRGRFGGWKYECSNQDHSFVIGMQFVDFLLFNQNETLNKV